VLEKKAKKREMLSENDDYLGSLAAAPSLLGKSLNLKIFVVGYKSKPSIFFCLRNFSN